MTSVLGYARKGENHYRSTGYKHLRALFSLYDYCAGIHCMNIAQSYCYRTNATWPRRLYRPNEGRDWHQPLSCTLCYKSMKPQKEKAPEREVIFPCPSNASLAAECCFSFVHRTHAAATSVIVGATILCGIVSHEKESCQSIVNAEGGRSCGYAYLPEPSMQAHLGAHLAGPPSR